MWVDGDPWFPLGTDMLGRDVFARLVRGARLSLGVAGLAAAAALIIGALVGGVAGVVGGPLDTLLMKLADFVIALPAIYVVLTLRASLPLVLPTSTVFWTMTGVLASRRLAARSPEACGRSSQARTGGSTQKLRGRGVRAVLGYCCVICCLPRPVFSACRRPCSCPVSSSPKPRFHTWVSDLLTFPRAGASCSRIRPAAGSSPKRPGS